MATTKPLIVIIDDDFTQSQPLYGFLENEYTADNVHLFQNSSDGVKFIEESLSRKVIVLLDIMFNGQEVGVDVFNAIAKQSALVCFIVMTGNIEQVSKKGLTSLVNGHAWYIVQRDKPAKEILNIVKDAENHINLRVDGALEEWILRHTPDEQQRPFLKSRSGSTYSLLDILQSLRGGDNNGIGQQIANDILVLAVDLLLTDQTKIGGGE
ncbi:response regulator [Mucilaginibacter rubeus]|uniref:Response regulator n=1 Tax=Mucilaginibacter rubeus TaxID=2027860 RepID=A0A5C1I300_9SPHI|nr:response regulator [Mucilaginibacter rubeus]QEM12216.1 response regulator [Mucilaginibacter rubeus]